MKNLAIAAIVLFAGSLMVSCGGSKGCGKGNWYNNRNTNIQQQMDNNVTTIAIEAEAL